MSVNPQVAGSSPARGAKNTWSVQTHCPTHKVGLFVLCSDSNDARDFLPSEAHTLRFINADLIAAGLAPFNPESAAVNAGLKNFNQHYCYAVDSWMLYDNSGMTPKLLDWSDK